MRILVVEDDTQLAGYLKQGLTEEGYAVDVATDGDEGEAAAESTFYDLIILDIMLPKKDGVQVCRELRDKRIASRVLMLTAKRDLVEKVQGLDSGADDYLTKPFEFPELYARVRALLRRGVEAGSPVLRVADITLNTITKEVKRSERPIALTRTEYVILHYLMSNQGVIVTKSMIENHVWNTSSETGANLVEVHVGRLRAKLGDRGDGAVIKTARGFGYVMGSQ